MLRLTTTLIVSFLIIAQASAVWAESKTFKVSVTIPAIIGLNVFAPGSLNGAQALNAPSWTVVEQRMVRNDKEVIVRSIVML